MMFKRLQAQSTCDDAFGIMGAMTTGGHIDQEKFNRAKATVELCSGIIEKLDLEFKRMFDEMIARDVQFGNISDASIQPTTETIS